jgi:serine/threonine protein kinase
MGEVYRARDPRLNREVAIKVLTEEAARNRDRLRRFIAEAKAASALNHPNILTVHEIGETDGGPYIVTELVSGRTVRELLSEKALPLGRALDIAIQTADGIGKAHEAGIVHRDLKPENLYVVSPLAAGRAKEETRCSGGIAGPLQPLASRMSTGEAGTRSYTGSVFPFPA